MNVTKLPDGRYVVVQHGRQLAGPFERNADAWRTLDRLEGEPVSKAEEKSEWVVGKVLREGS